MRLRGSGGTEGSPPAAVLYLLTGAVGHAELHVELAVVHHRLGVACWVLGLVDVHAVSGSVDSQLLFDLVQEETPEPQRPELKPCPIKK